MHFDHEHSEYIKLVKQQEKFKNVEEKIFMLGNLKDSKIAYYSFLIASFLTIFVTCTYIGSALGLIIKMPIIKYEFYIFPIIITIILSFLLKLEKEKYYIVIPIISLIIYFLISFSLMYLNKYIWDISSDSLGYHQPMVINLFKGWNPYYNPIYKEPFNIWCVVYPKANAIYATVVYKLTGNIAEAKILSCLLPIISGVWVFAFMASLLRKTKKLTAISISFIVGVVAIINPINLEQMFTFYVDSSFGSMLIILLILTYYLIFFEGLKKIKFVVLLGVIVFLSNIKFTGFIYAGGIMMCVLIFCFFYETKENIKNIIITLIVIFIVTIGIIGFNPYITNLWFYHSIFYPLIGNNSIDIMTPNTPIYLLHRNNISQFFYSLIANISNGTSASGTVAKFPDLLKINPDVIKYYSFPDPRLRGFGLLGFIIEPITILIFVWYFIKKYKSMNKHLKIFTIGIAIIITGLTLEAGGYWWARYIPYFWILPTLLIGILINDKSKKFKFIGIGLLLIILANSTIFIFAFKYKIQSSDEFKNIIFNNQSRILKEGSYGWQAMETRFKEYDIPFTLVK
ncbi:MAG: hypothetical protein ACRC41_09395 [Sarcina sp.]